MEACGRYYCCGIGVPVGCVTTICRVAIMIATCGIGSVIRRHRLTAGISTITDVELGGVCETGVRFDTCSS